ncbi:hypothetical protein [Paraburkholderia atlantica]|uniref:DUF4148 domain-containing protein n=1 Tax=Paraburkholderia atlantica TaxID=2654982 RepID=D5WIW5_PARAM|nr:hypothetical protein [Paraburkholderia atlantica]ADG18410.1 conserved hypothetical protein [Paraburkholderia atlantica]MBB5504660.1 hypothetical protein [Paraburkholderia atlantica]
MKSIKSLIQAGVIAALIAAPFAVFAQSNQADQPLPRAQVHDSSNANVIDYRAPIQPVEAKLAAQKQAAQNSGYGAPSNGSSQRSGRTEFAPTSYSVPVVNYTR